ncbi:hypothetical protein FWK35_00016497 [Aphis craccivora]|uniref:Uncharacterized protein n=1 Tax=Aphis craccivora TaxID=307492 RepID=A0A6G0YQW0_APHCR|nr:hypothetical protein FWK35_00016497 [Aphis craccivora]
MMCVFCLSVYTINHRKITLNFTLSVVLNRKLDIV